MDKAQQTQFDLLYQEHVNALARQGKSEKTIEAYARRGKYLFNEFALAKVFRARFLEAMCDDNFKAPDKNPKQ